MYGKRICKVKKSLEHGICTRKARDRHGKERVENGSDTGRGELSTGIARLEESRAREWHGKGESGAREWHGEGKVEYGSGTGRRE